MEADEVPQTVGQLGGDVVELSGGDRLTEGGEHGAHVSQRLARIGPGAVGHPRHEGVDLELFGLLPDTGQVGLQLQGELRGEVVGLPTGLMNSS